MNVLHSLSFFQGYKYGLYRPADDVYVMVILDPVATARFFEISKDPIRRNSSFWSALNHATYFQPSVDDGQVPRESCLTRRIINPQSD
jgi:hypothetical protein